MRAVRAHPLISDLGHIIIHIIIISIIIIIPTTLMRYGTVAAPGQSVHFSTTTINRLGLASGHIWICMMMLIRSVCVNNNSYNIQ